MSIVINGEIYLDYSHYLRKNYWDIYLSAMEKKVLQAMREELVGQPTEEYNLSKEEQKEALRLNRGKTSMLFKGGN